MKQLNILRKCLNKFLTHKIITTAFRTKVVAVILLAIISFTFLHSEAGLFDFDDSNHCSHDYCELVKNVNSHSNILQQKLPLIKFIDVICSHCFEKFEMQMVQTSFEKENQNLKANLFFDLYLFNKTFLI